MTMRTVLIAMSMAIVFITAACSPSEKSSDTPAPTPAEPASAPAAPGSDLKQIEQKKSGDYVITLLNETGSLKQGANKLVLEFRREDQLTDPGNVQVKPMMEMKGLGPMMATATAIPNGTGRFEISTDLAMAGVWKVMVTFMGGEAEFDLSAQ
jgi:hypothetical protein